MKDLNKLGKSYIGKTCQSIILTEISSNGGKVISAPEKITGYEIIEMFGKPDLMLIVGGEYVLEQTCFNFSK